MCIKNESTFVQNLRGNTSGGATYIRQQFVQPSRNGVSPFVRQVAGMALHCVMICATCLATVFRHLQDNLDLSLRWCYTVQYSKKVVAAIVVKSLNESVGN